MNFERLKKACHKAGIEEVELYLETVKGLEISTFNGSIDNQTACQTEVMAIRGVYQNQIVTVYEENASDDQIDAIVERIKDNAGIMNSQEPYFMYGGDERYPEIPSSENDLDEFSLDDKKKLCFELEKKIQAQSSYVTKVNVSYSERYTSVLIKNTNGLDVQRQDVSIYFVASCVCQKNEDTKTGYEVYPVKLLKNIDLDTLSHQVVDKAIQSFGAESIASGAYPVVLDKRVVGNLLSAFSGIFSAESVLKNMSFLKDQLNNSVFGSNITIVDDPLSTEANSQYAFDDEGVACRTKTVVENGVLKTYLHNLKTASMMNTKSTGNGFKTSVASSIGIQASNLYLKGGDLSFDELLSKAQNGVYITNITGLHAGLNPISGTFNLQSSGYLIENGVQSKPVNLIILSGSLQELLNHITGLGSDFEFRFGIGAPSVLVESLAISGK